MNNPLHESWGKRVRKRRSGIYTQEALAATVGVRQSTISKIEAGDICPSDDLKFKLAGALGITVEDLFPYPAIVPPYPGQVA